MEMENEKNDVLESLFKSIRTFGNITVEAENRDKLWKYNDILMQSLHSIIEDGDCDEAEKLQYFNTSMEQYVNAMTELFPKLIVPKNQHPLDTPKKAVGKSANRYDEIEEIEKFNPYHDERGRFSTADGYASFTIQTKDPKKQHMADAAIAREKERAGAAASKPEAKPAETKPAKQPEEQKAPKEQTEETGGIKAFGKTTLPSEMLKTCQEVEAKTVSRKTEKMTLVGEDGQIILEKSGGKGSVSFGAREGFQMNDTTVVTHNHPGEYGGTFSGADVQVFVDYRLKAIRAVGAEGTYSLERTSKVNSSSAYDFNQDFKARSNNLNDTIRKEYNSMKSKVARGEVKVDDANKQLSERRTTLCNDQHDWLTQNAEKYGFNYVFTPSGASTGVGKADNSNPKETEPDDTSGEVVLDGEFMNGDNWMIK